MKSILNLLFILLCMNLVSAQTNTGIGTITPTERLDVNGNVKFNGALMPNNIPGSAGQILTSTGANTAPVWSSQPPGAVQLIKEVIGTTAQTIAQGAIADITGASLTFATTGVTTILITYSALPLPNAASAPVQGSIDLIVDGTKQISSYYSSTDAPTTIVKLGNYSTAQKVLTNVTAGSHTIKLQAKSWVNTTVFNFDPFTGAYLGATASDGQSMKARIAVVVLNN